MSVNLSPLGGAGAQFFSNDGVPLSGGLLYTYQAGTTTPATTYTSGSGITALSNPIVLDSAGRVPTGEIWLTDGINYKFVLKDTADVLIATWDGLSGINSNFVAYTAQEETATATAGQTVFTLALTYLVGTDNLAVFVNGSKQIVNVNYLETDGNTVTFLSGLNVGDVVEFNTASPVATNITNAANVQYTPAGAAAVNTSVQNKLRESVSVKDFGATGDGSTDDTTAIQNALNSGAAQVFFPKGQYRFTQTLTIPVNTQVIGSDSGAPKFNTATAKTRLIYDGSATVAITFAQSSGVAASSLQNIVLYQSSATANVTAIQIGNASDTTTYAIQTLVQNVIVSYFTGVGILNYGSWNCTLRDIMVHGNPSARTTIGYYFNCTGQASTSLFVENCAAEECVTGFKVGASNSNIYSYSSMINTYVDGCENGYWFIGNGSTSRVFNLFRASVEAFNVGSAFIVDGINVSVDGLAFVNAGASFGYVVKADNSAELIISNADLMPQTGFTGGTAVMLADNNSIIRLRNTRVTTASGETIQQNGGRIDQDNRDRITFRYLNRTEPLSQDITFATRNNTYSGYQQYNFYTSAGALQNMAGTPIFNVANIDIGQIIEVRNVGSADNVVLRTEDVVANTGIIRNVNNVYAGGIQLTPNDYVKLIKKADGKLYELRSVI